MRRICTICARGGSKGVKNKNIRILRGKPLLAHSIAQALETRLFDAVAVGSDSDEILRTGERYGATHVIRRPDELASDAAAKLPAMRHCVQSVEASTGSLFEVVVDLDATSPLRTVGDIANAVAMLEDGDVSNVITAMPARRSPYFNMVELTPDGKVVLAKQLHPPVVRRQDAPKCFDMNASVYVWWRDVFMQSDTLFLEKTALYVMPEERSIDIDSELDFQFVEFLAGLKGGE